MDKFKKLLVAASVAAVSHVASAAGTGGISLNQLPLVGSLLGAPGAPSLDVNTLPVISSLVAPTTAIIPNLSGLPPGVGLLPVLAPLTGGSAVFNFGFVPGIGPLLFGGVGGNVLSLNGLFNGSFQKVVGDIIPSSGDALNIANLIPFQAGVLGIGTLVPPSIASVLSKYLPANVLNP
jgi:hypothetical protein